MDFLCSNADTIAALPAASPCSPAVCPRGFFENSTSLACERCPKDSYCPGGDRVQSPNTRGTAFPCGSYLVTRGSGARSLTDCLAQAGYARTSANTATICGQSEYAPALNRLSRCLRCQSGLQEDTLNGGLGTVNKPRDTKRNVCSK